MYAAGGGDVTVDAAAYVLSGKAGRVSDGSVDQRVKTDDGALPRIVRRTQAFAQLTGGYKTFRIPSMVVAADGKTLLVAAEGRAPQGPGRPSVGNVSLCWGELASLYDWQCCACKHTRAIFSSAISFRLISSRGASDRAFPAVSIDAKDIVIRRSTDSGATFSPIQVIASSNESVLYTNPLGLLDHTTKQLWLAYVRCPIPPGAPPDRSVFQNCTQIVRNSVDNGGSWSAEREVSGSYPQVRPESLVTHFCLAFPYLLGSLLVTNARTMAASALACSWLTASCSSRATAKGC